MERLNRYQASRSDEGRYRLLVEAITDYAIYMLDPDGIVTSWNPGAQKFKGYLADEIVGEHFSRFYPEEARTAGVPAEALRTAELAGERLALVQLVDLPFPAHPATPLRTISASTTFAPIPRSSTTSGFTSVGCVIGDMWPASRIVRCRACGSGSTSSPSSVSSAT